MASVEGAGEVEIFKAHLRHHAWIRKDESFFGLGEDDREPGLLGGKFSNGRYVNASLIEPLQTYFAERIFTDGGMKADTISEKGKVVGKDRGRASERETQIGSEVLAIQFEMARKTVENEVQIQFADYTDIEFMVAAHSPAQQTLNRGGLHDSSFSVRPDSELF
jgi:hypothetical protein